MSCNTATAAGQAGGTTYQQMCWFDFSNYSEAAASSASGQNFSVALGDGGALSFNLKKSTTGTATILTPQVDGWTSAAFNDADGSYTGIAGNPELNYGTKGQGGQTRGVQLIVSNLRRTDFSGAYVATTTLYTVDGESTNRDAVNSQPPETWGATTTGTAWTNVQTLPPNGGGSNQPTLSTSNGGKTVTLTGVNTALVGSTIFSTTVAANTASTDTVSLNAQGIDGSAQGFALGVVLPIADVSIAETGPSTATAGTTVTYTLALGNNGPSRANGVTFSDSVPSGLSNITAACLSPSGGVSGCTTSVTGNTVSGSVGTFPNGGSVQIVVSGTATGSAPLTNTASISTPSTLYDSNVSNNTSTVTTTLVNPPLDCVNNFYALLGTTGNFRTIAGLSASGTVGATTATVPDGNNDDNAALAVSADGSKLFVATGDGSLRVFDVTSGQWVANVAISGAPRMVRMAVTKPTAANPKGVGYFSVGTQLWSFQTTAPYTVSAPLNLTYTDTSGLSPAPIITGSGDFFADDAGNLFLSVNNGSSGSYIDIFIVRLGGSASFLGRLNDSSIGTSDTYGGYAALGGNIYGSSSGGRIISVDLTALTVNQTAASSSSRGTSDLASCSYPHLAPIMSATKTAAKVAGSAGSTVVPGDTIEYTIIAKNTGTLNAADVTLQDAIPTGTTYVAGSTTLNTIAVSDNSGVMPFVVAKSINSPGSASGIVRVDTTPSNTTDREATLKFRVKVNAGATSVSNQATLRYTDNSTGSAVTIPILTDDPTTPALNDPTVVATGAPALVVTKTVDKAYAVYPTLVGTADPVAPPLVYTVTVQNTGALPATGVTLTDSLPAGVSNPVVTEGGAAVSATLSGQTLSWSPGTVTAGTTRTFTISVTAPSAATLRATQPQTVLVNSVVASASNAATSAPATASTNTVYSPLFKQQHNLGKLATPTAAPIPAASPAWASNVVGLPGDVLEYCIDFLNYGSTPLNNYVITDSVPANSTIVPDSWVVKQGNMSATPITAFPGAAVGYSAGVVSVTLATLPVNTTGSMCFRTFIK